MSHLHFWTHFNYYLFKLWLLLATGLPHPVLHIYLGLLIQFSICAALRLRIAHPTPLFFVYFAEFYNELNDLFAAVPDVGHEWLMGTAFDYANTIIIPTALFLLARYTRVLGHPPQET